MTTITRSTKEQLLKRLEEQMSSARYALGFVQDSEILRDIEMDLRLAEIARASLTAEPIGAFHISDQQVEGTSDYIKDGEWPIDNGVIEVYTAPPAPEPMKDHQIRELVNDLRDIAVEYHGTQQLRERIARTVRSAMLQAGNSPVAQDCWFSTCRPVTMNDMRFVVCPDCGNKRCPRANDHRNACTGSNEPGQEGSAYPAAPHQEVKSALEHGMRRYAGAMQKLSEGDD